MVSFKAVKLKNYEAGKEISARCGDFIVFTQTAYRWNYTNTTSNVCTLRNFDIFDQNSWSGSFKKYFKTFAELIFGVTVPLSGEHVEMHLTFGSDGQDARLLWAALDQ